MIRSSSRRDADTAVVLAEAKTTDWVCDICGQKFPEEVDLLAHQFNSQCEKDLIVRNRVRVLSKPKPEPRKKGKRNPPMDKEAYKWFRIAHGWSLFCDSGSGKDGHNMHHCLIGRKKGYPILDDYRNIAWVNQWDHDRRTFDNRNWRRRFWALQVKRFGLSAMNEWARLVVEAGLVEDRLDFLK